MELDAAVKYFKKSYTKLFVSRKNIMDLIETIKSFGFNTINDYDAPATDDSDEYKGIELMNVANNNKVCFYIVKYDSGDDGFSFMISYHKQDECIVEYIINEWTEESFGQIRSELLYKYLKNELYANSKNIVQNTTYVYVFEKCIPEEYTIQRPNIVKGWYIRFEEITQGFSFKANKPFVSLYHGPAEEKPKYFHELSNEDYENAKNYAGKQLRGYAEHYSELNTTSENIYQLISYPEKPNGSNKKTIYAMTFPKSDTKLTFTQLKNEADDIGLGIVEHDNESYRIEYYENKISEYMEKSLRFFINISEFYSPKDKV